MIIRNSIFILLFCIALFSNYACKQKESFASNNLEEQFLNPPTSGKLHVWWLWMGSNFSKEGITKDLEAMKESGIGGATIIQNKCILNPLHPVRITFGMPFITLHFIDSFLI